MIYGISEFSVEIRNNALLTSLHTHTMHTGDCDTRTHAFSICGHSNRRLARPESKEKCHTLSEFD